MYGIKNINKLADLIGVSPSMLHRVYNGQRAPGAKVISGLLIFFQEPFDAFFTEEDGEQSAKSE
jgi:transcriptional regulator with XRE-family HTH domain